MNEEEYKNVVFNQVVIILSGKLLKIKNLSSHTANAYIKDNFRDIYKAVEKSIEKNTTMSLR